AARRKSSTGGKRGSAPRLLVTCVGSVRERWLSFALPLSSAGCGGWQSALDPHGLDAQNVHGLIRLFVIVAIVTWLLVMLFLAGALWHRRAAPAEPGVHPAGERRATIAVAVAV